ncbi:MAG: DUF2294 domain-containing protein [Gammaproteobacteria bacterium]
MAASEAPQAKHEEAGASQSTNGSLNAAISNAVVKMLAESTGRGPTKARTTIDRDLVMVVLQDTLTKGERFLVESERSAQVLEMRRHYQAAMETDCRAAVERLMGRKVIAFMSANNIGPDIGAEIFILEPDNGRPPAADLATSHAERG